MDSNIDLAAYIERISAGWPALHVALARAGLAEAIENQVRSAQEEQERLAARAAALQAQRTAETEKALSLLDAAWVAAFPDLPDRVRTAIYDRNDFDTCADLIVPLPDLPGMAPMFVCLVRQWTGGGKNAFVVAKLQGDVIGQQYMRDNFPHNQPEYSSSIVAKSLEQLFFRAAYAGAQFAAWQAAHAEYAEDEAHQEAARAADERARTADSAADQAGQRAADAERQVEIERIIAWAKTDPAVLNLVRAFMAIEEERDAFQSRLHAADEAAGEAWGYHDKRVAELRLTIEEARAEADRQRQAARAAEYEADEARRKIKDVERRANSYSRYDY